MKLKKMLAETYDNVKEDMRAKLAPIRRKNIIDTSFSIISNNCWGGIVYQRYGLPYTSPTIGLYFFADDYIKLLGNLRYYMSIPMTTIQVEESAHKETIIKRHHEVFPLGRIDDVEVVFRHYSTSKEAIDKWERRKKRINYDNIIVKFSEMNLCTEDLVKEFLNVPYDTKFAFVNNHNKVKDNQLVYYHGYELLDFIPDDTKYYSKYIDINTLINRHEIVSECTPMLS